jgi:hypothetical protein
MLPTAPVIFDRFHVSHLFNKAMSETRRGLQRELKGLKFVAQALARPSQTGERLNFPESRGKRRGVEIAQKRLA